MGEFTEHALNKKKKTPPAASILVGCR